MKITVVLVTLMLSQLAILRAADPSPARPNFILFLIDDQNAESIGAFGGRTYTPNLDNMAAEGMRFTRAYVSSAVCTPSRYSFFTGRYAGASHSKRYIDDCGGPNQQGFVGFNMALERDCTNVARVLADAGYATGFTGKFHLGSELDWPHFFEGVHRLNPIPRKAAASDQMSELFAHNEHVMRKYLQELGFSWAKHIYPQNLQDPYSQHNPEWTLQAALEFLDLQKDKQRPFYLHITPTLLHGAQGSWRRSMNFPLVSGEGELEAAPQVMTPRAELQARVKAAGFDPDSPTAGEAWIDDALGAVLAKLKALGLDHDTLIVFAPDHGRDGKGSLFQHNGTRIPMIARWPARIPAGTVCDELVQNIDWAPTCFELAAAKRPDNYTLHGRSLAPLLTTGTANAWRDHLYFEMGYARSVSTKDFSYIAVRYPQDVVAQIQRATPEQLPRLMTYMGRLGFAVRGAQNPSFWDADQLYDLRRDPKETKNLAADLEHAAQLAAMHEMLASDIKAVGRPFGEFLPGGNAAPPGQVDAQIARVKTLEVHGKTVRDPEADEGTPSRKTNRKNKKASRK